MQVVGLRLGVDDLNLKIHSVELIVLLKVMNEGERKKCGGKESRNEDTKAGSSPFPPLLRLKL
jgi:hypothetical protein